MTFWLIIAAWIGVIVGFAIGTFWSSAQISRTLEEARTARMLQWEKAQKQHMRESWRNAAKAPFEDHTIDDARNAAKDN